MLVRDSYLFVELYTNTKFHSLSN